MYYTLAECYLKYKELSNVKGLIILLLLIYVKLRFEVRLQLLVNETSHIIDMDVYNWHIIV